MTRYRPLFRTVRADGATYSLTFADDGTWMILLGEELVEAGQSTGGGVEEAVDKFKALSLPTPQRKLARAS